MRREIDGKKFIQGKDLIAIADLSLANVPDSLWKKFFDQNDPSDEYEKDIEITTEAELSFYNSITSSILSERDLNELKTKLQELQIEYVKDDKTETKSEIAFFNCITSSILLKNDLDELSLDQLDKLKDSYEKLYGIYINDNTVSIVVKNKRLGILEYKKETLASYIGKTNKYLETLNPEARKYLNILSKDFPAWLTEYIYTNAVQRLKYISQNCGTDYTKIFPVRFHYSTLEHSVAVALIMWNFTHDEKQTLAGLFHDIATPAFKHCIDFMNGDSLTQESTEAYTKKILEESTDIMALLKRDGIKVEEVANPKLYPLLDNKVPTLCADRIDSTFFPGIANEKVWEFKEIKDIYDNLEIGKNEYGVDEFILKNQILAVDYVCKSARIFKSFMSDKNRTIMQFIADILKSMIYKGYLTVEDLYKLSEEEIINRILNCEDEYLSDNFKEFLNLTKVYKSDRFIDGRYSIKVGSKRRYIDPLLFKTRISNISYEAYSAIENIINTDFDYYTYLDIEFIPYIKGYSKKS